MDGEHLVFRQKQRRFVQLFRQFTKHRCKLLYSFGVSFLDVAVFCEPDWFLSSHRIVMRLFFARSLGRFEYLSAHDEIILK